MCSRYINEAYLISAMAKWLRDVPTLSDTVSVVFALRDGGFARRDIRDFREAAITAERSRRLAYARVIP